MNRKVLPLLVAIALLSLSASAADPWTGKSRDEVTATLGVPSKTKKSGEILVYKLHRAHEKAPAGPGVLLLEVPGVGLVVRPVRDFDPLAGETLSIEPSEGDGEGRLVPGGVTTTSSRTVSWSTEDGRFDPGDEMIEVPRLGKKIRLTFRLDPTGKVVDWSVSPKP